MKKAFYVGLLAAGIGLSLGTVSLNAEAYQCGWHNGHKVCWQSGQRYCRWAGGYWHNGYYHKGHRVCWYRR